MLERFHLMLIREVERQGAITAAAETLCLTQSALSHAVKKIAQYLGTPIWSREGRNLRLTEAGRYLLQVANRLPPQLEHAETVMRQYAAGEGGNLRIGMECHPCYQWLLKVVAPYLAAWPDVDVDVDVKQKFQFGGKWLAEKYALRLAISVVRLGREGIAKQIFLGLRESDRGIGYLKAFVDLARDIE